MANFTRKKAYFINAAGRPKGEEVFIETFSKLTGKPFEESYNQVMEVMRTLQEMLLSHKIFMLPGIGVIGLAENPKRGIVLSTATYWWTPGLLAVIGAFPGWENAPLNSYLTEENIDAINVLVARIPKEERVTLSPSQFFMSSDFGKQEGKLSDERLSFYKGAEAYAERKRQHAKTSTKNALKVASDNDRLRNQVIRAAFRKYEEYALAKGLEDFPKVNIAEEMERIKDMARGHFDDTVQASDS